MIGLVNHIYKLYKRLIKFIKTYKQWPVTVMEPFLN